MSNSLTSRLLWIITGLCLLLPMSLSSCKQQGQTGKKATSGLVEKITTREIQISGSQAAILDNQQLRCRFFLVRHAEKDTTTERDPSLLPAGELRAKRLAEILQDLPLRRIYATNFQRTRLTAAPTAAAMHLETQTYSADTQNDLLDQLIGQSEGGNYLIVGHSNSVPKMLNHLTGKSVYKSISESIYDNLFVASIYQDGRVDILELKY